MVGIGFNFVYKTCNFHDRKKIKSKWIATAYFLKCLLRAGEATVMKKYMAFTSSAILSFGVDRLRLLPPGRYKALYYLLKVIQEF